MTNLQDPEVIRAAVTIGTGIVTWILVVWGWRKTHRTAASRAHRQEEFGQVEGIEKRIDTIRDMAIAYYVEGADVPYRVAKQVQLKYELQGLASRIELLHTRRPEFYNLASALIAFRQDVTGGEFESATREAVAPDAAVIQAVWVSADLLVFLLHKAFEEANKAS